MSPKEGLDALGVNPAAESKFAFGDLDFLVFAFFILAASSAGGGLLCFQGEYSSIYAKEKTYVVVKDNKCVRA